MGRKKRSGQCPFCGAVGPLSGEHVWGKWLHETESAKQLLAGAHGERLPVIHTELSVSKDGRIQENSIEIGKIQKYLPNVQVSVCGSCNNGWMSALENRVKHALGPFMFREKPWVKIEADTAGAISGWVVTAMMSYLTNRQSIKNPFTQEDYRRMADESVPPTACQVWMFHSHHPGAEVGLGVYSTYVTDSVSVKELTEERDNYFVGYLSAARVIFCVVLNRMGWPREVNELLIPEELKNWGVRRIWPAPRAQLFPLDNMPNFAFENLLRFAAGLDELGLPAVGLNSDELKQVQSEFLRGGDPQVIRKKWEDLSSDRRDGH